jgi:RNA polymerase sigma-70 factor (family 1)
MNFPGQKRGDAFQQLKILVAKGDEVAFRKIFDLLFDPLAQFAFSLVKSKEVATEVIDDVFIRLWNNRSTILSIENLKVYLYTSAKNSALNYLSRTAQRNVIEPFDDINIELKDDFCPERIMITNEILNKIREAVDTLPPRCKIIFKLVREDSLKYKEVAEILNLSVKTVDAQMVIAINRIREELKNQIFMPAKKNPQKN